MLNVVRLAYLVTLVLVLAFVWHTTQALSGTVVAGIDASGHVRGSMSRDMYLVLQFALQLGLPWLVVALPTWAARRGGCGLNIPNQAYWLAPERRADTVGRLATLLYAFALGLSLFLAWVHWSMVQLQTAPGAATAWPQRLGAGIGVVAAATLAWVFAATRAFRRP